MEFLLFTFVGVVHLLSLSSGKPIYKNDISRRTFQEIKEEIASYGDVAKAIIDLAVYGKAQNRSYERLALLVDTVGPRPSGSRSLEKAIQIMYQNLREDGLENVHLEPVKIPHWERGEESAVMLEPRIHRMAILGLGSSIGTPPEGITAEVLVVTSFEELQRRAPEARGKIVVYNQPYVNYSTTVQYRVQGAVEAAKVGALASLIRSVASFSIYRANVEKCVLEEPFPGEIRVSCGFAEACTEVSLGGGHLISEVEDRKPSTMHQFRVGHVIGGCARAALAAGQRPHTGIQEYQDGVPKIPTACITVEDAEMMSRMASRGNRIVIQLKMGAKNYPDADSFNTVAEIIGSKYPEQVVLVSGHLDSWDVGQGAMDDGGGAFISWEALSLIKDLDSLFSPGHQLKLYSINLTEEILEFCKYNPSFLSSCQQKAICCEMLLNTSLCLCFAGLESVYLKCHFLECSGVHEQSPRPKMLCFRMFVWHLKNKPPSISKFFQLYHFQ
ncbi:carboxypeptidase Q isoform X2 [Canis lupus baileyi]|uniref:carboxypeptidase Q isoform X2 n=1 Tax=Canis lupus dingo TaxID=286419 RepID=UPI0015F14ACE|nr:carboxypeptidase Q isoform X2 [Canis lupus dingo]